MSLTDCSFVYNHFQKMGQLAQGNRKIVVLLVFVVLGNVVRWPAIAPYRCMEKGHWAGLQYTPDVMRTRYIHTFALCERVYEVHASC